MNYLSTIRYGNKQVSLLDTFIYATFDPGGGTGPANATTQTDKVGWTVGAVTVSSDFLILEWGEEYMEVTSLVTKLLQVHRRWKPRLIGVERMMYLQQYMYAEMQRRGKILDVATLSHKGRNKAERIKAFMPFLSKTYFMRTVVEEAQKSLHRWHETMKHGDDGADSLAYFYDVAIPPTLNDLMSHRAERRQWAREERLDQLDPRTKAEAKAIGRFYERTRGSASEFTDSFTDS